MGLLSRAGDLVYTLRFLRLLTTPFKETNAYKLGIIDERGNRVKTKKVETSEEKSAYNYFHRLVFSLKRLLEKIPGGSMPIASYAAALYLIKEHLGITDQGLQRILKEYNIEPLDFLEEQSQWFISEDKMLSPGIYRITNEKLVNTTCEQLVNKNDKIRIKNDSYPVGDVFGISIYEATHIPTNQTIYVTPSELIK